MMKKIGKLMCLAAVLAALSMTLSGCGFQFTLVPEELYSLPKLPAEYVELDARIQTILAEGAEYAAPTSGVNIQPVQMVDLDSDGQEEALVFCRNAEDERPLKIYVFTDQDGSYVEEAVIKGNGTSIYSITYSDLNGDGWQELVVGWRIGTDLQALTVVSLQGDEPQELLRTNYVRYAITDLNQNGLQELVVLRSDDEGNSMAEYFRLQPDEMVRQSAVRISSSMAELSSQQGRVRSGMLHDGVPALFVTGVQEGTVYITDILTIRENELVNLMISDKTGVSTEIAPYLGLYPTDINGDTITELPTPVMLPVEDVESLQTHYRIDWRSIDSAGEGQIVLSTYHDMEDSWYLKLPEEWRDHIVVSRRGSGQDETAVTFSARGENGENTPILSIYTITGDSREVKAVRDGRIVLSRQAERIYAAKLLEGNASWEHGMTEDSLRAAFSLIAAEWSAGEN